MTNRKLHEWAAAYFRSLEPAEDACITLVIGALLGGLATLIVTVIVRW